MMDVENYTLIRTNIMEHYLSRPEGVRLATQAPSAPSSHIIFRPSIRYEDSSGGLKSVAGLFAESRRIVLPPSIPISIASAIKLYGNTIERSLIEQQPDSYMELYTLMWDRLEGIVHEDTTQYITRLNRMGRSTPAR